MGFSTLLPGEFLFRGSYWAGDLSVRCWSRQHVPLVVVAAVIGLPLLVL